MDNHFQFLLTFDKNSINYRERNRREENNLISLAEAFYAFDRRAFNAPEKLIILS